MPFSQRINFPNSLSFPIIQLKLSKAFIENIAASAFKMSTSPEPRPTYLYKILSSHPIEPFPIVYPLSALDAKDGFVHLSTAMQVIYYFFFSLSSFL